MPKGTRWGWRACAASASARTVVIEHRNGKTSTLTVGTSRCAPSHCCCHCCPSARFCGRYGQHLAGSQPHRRDPRGSSERKPSVLDPLDVVAARYWGLTLEEMERAKLLMSGPRGAFSDPRISPVEVLGVHARSAAERNSTPSSFARMLHEDTERVLAWNLAGSRAIQRLYPNEPVIDLGKRPGHGQGRIPNWYFAPPRWPVIAATTATVCVPRRTLLRAGAAALVLALPAHVLAARRKATYPPVPPAYRDAATRLGIPPTILYGVALQESALRWGGHALPWPVDPEHPPTATALRQLPDALAALKAALGRGVRNVDCGCMQNWGYHRARLQSPERALDPGTTSP